jgi:hypothetical protein
VRLTGARAECARRSGGETAAGPGALLERRDLRVGGVPRGPAGPPGSARSAGVGAIEFDNVDAYQNKTGLTISAATEEQFDAAIASTHWTSWSPTAAASPAPGATTSANRTGSRHTPATSASKCRWRPWNQTSSSTAISRSELPAALRVPLPRRAHHRPVPRDGGLGTQPARLATGRAPVHRLTRGQQRIMTVSGALTGSPVAWPVVSRVAWKDR